MDAEMIAGKVGDIADSMDNILAATELVLPAEMHKEQMKLKIEEWSRQLKAIYVEVTGENPWAGLS